MSIQNGQGTRPNIFSELSASVCVHNNFCNVNLLYYRPYLTNELAETDMPLALTVKDIQIKRDETGIQAQNLPSPLD